jgi:flagellar hook-length control protein FliK
MAQPTLVQPTLGQPAVTPPATEMVPDRDGNVDPSATAAIPARAGRTAGGDAPQRDRAMAAASDGRTPRDLPGIPGNQATGLTQLLPASTEAGTRTAKGPADVTEEVRSARQRRSAGREDLRNPTEFPGAARRRDGLQDPIRPAPDVRQAERPTDRLTEGLTERAADRPADPAARIDTMVRTDPAPRLDTPPPAAERAGSVPVLYVDHSLGSPEWQREFGSQVSVLVSRREPQAEVRLNPPQLGPVEIRIGLQGDQVSLAFTALHPDTRAAIENALPQLREMFAGNGLALGNASVNAESSQQQSHRGTHQNGVSFPNQEPMVAESMPPIRRVAVRLVDTFA